MVCWWHPFPMQEQNIKPINKKTMYVIGLMKYRVAITSVPWLHSYILIGGWLEWKKSYHHKSAVAVLLAHVSFICTRRMQRLLNLCKLYKNRKKSALNIARVRVHVCARCFPQSCAHICKHEADSCFSSFGTDVNVDNDRVGIIVCSSENQWVFIGLQLAYVVIMLVSLLLYCSCFFYKLHHHKYAK